MKLLSISTLPVVSLLAVLALSSRSIDNGDAHSATKMPGMSGGSMAGSSSPTVAAQSPASGPHNNADVSFATDMIPHHAQAVQMADGDMSALAAASGAAFDRSRVRLMITHHSGAVAMSKKELATGSSDQARALARQIIDAQIAEIARLRTVLATLPG